MTKSWQTATITSVFATIETVVLQRRTLYETNVELSHRKYGVVIGHYSSFAEIPSSEIFILKDLSELDPTHEFKTLIVLTILLHLFPTNSLSLAISCR